MTSIAIITTCKGRLAFLKQTLPRMVATGFPVTVVDYDCPEGTGDWVRANFPDVNVVAVTDRPVFNHSEARNIGAAASSSDIFTFIDADVLLNSTFAKFIQATDFQTNRYFIGDGALDATVVGVCVVSSFHFNRIGGYDQVISGWGYEDIDLYVRFRVDGLERCFVPRDTLEPIEHGDELRVAFTPQKIPGESYRLNHIYSRIKIDLEGITRHYLSLGERQQVRTMVTSAIASLKTTAVAETVPLSIAISEERVASGNNAIRFTRSLNYSLTLD